MTSKGPGRFPFRMRYLLIGLIVLVAALIVAKPYLIDVLGGAWKRTEGSWEAQLSPEARALVAEVCEGVEPGSGIDVHVHLAGLGTGDSGCEVNPRMRSWAHPIEHVRFDLYLSASGVQELERADQEFVDRLAELARTARPGGRLCVMAFDRHYREDGSVDLDHTEFYVPNEWAWKVAESAPEFFLPVISVHPYRPDAIEELQRWGERGARMVKWLPNAMGIDPASPRCDAFYAAMVELDLTLLSHTGKELAVDAAELQELGNPLRLRRPLDAGVRVIAAHCASLGESLDLDDPAEPPAPNFDLWLRLMDEERYVGLLWGDLSAITLINRIGRPLNTLLERKDLHPRLVNGTDYPIPAINAAIHLGPLVDDGVLDEERVEALEEIYRLHPLTFDFALKRSLHPPGGGEGFDSRCFVAPPELGL